jgi:hypothetical protein
MSFPTCVRSSNVQGGLYIVRCVPTSVQGGLCCVKNVFVVNFSVNFVNYLLV